MKIVITHAIDSGESVGGKNKAKIENMQKVKKHNSNVRWLNRKYIGQPICEMNR